MASKRITGRQLRRGTPEGKLSPGQSLLIEKRGGKRLELTRVDAGPVNFNTRMDQIFQEIPVEGKRVKTNLARTILGERI
jgi:hypothetical protein